MNDTENINYQPLEAEQHALKLTFKHYRVPSIVIIIIATVVIFIVPVVGFGLLLLWFVSLIFMASALKNGLWEEFAAVNGWPVNGVEDTSTVIPLSLQFGHDQDVSPAITATLGGITTDMLVYTTMTGEGRYQVGHVFTLARVELPITLPHILLRAKRDRAVLQQDFANHEAMQLEGDFGDYFSLQIENGQEVNVLEILTPDVMQTLVSYSQHEDVEIGGNDLYFIIAGDDRGVEGVRQLVQSVVSLSVQIIEHIEQTTASSVQPPAVPVPTATTA
jgi:hypothetical protein